jgi:Xaa-Pro aminopeptidase
MVADLAKKHKFKAVGFESGIVTHAFFKALERTVGADKLKATGDLVETLRIVKEPEEIVMLRRSADIAVKGFHYIKETARAGMTELELQARLEYFTKSIGSEKPAFDIIIATGAKASMPHAITDQTKVKDNEVLLVDMGVVYGGYHSDLTRPIFLGRMSALHKKIYDIVWQAQRHGIAKAGPGVAASDVDKACRDYIRKAGYDKYFGHSTGHGVGLEIHEAPSVSTKSKTILKPGMVITVEPGIYLPGKFGIRIEDMVLITPNGRDVLTKGLEK